MEAYVELLSNQTKTSKSYLCCFRKKKELEAIIVEASLVRESSSDFKLELFKLKTGFKKNLAYELDFKKQEFGLRAPHKDRVQKR